MRKALLVMMMVISCITLTAQTLAKNDPLKFDADYYLMEKDFTKALNTYQTILRSEPDNADIKYKVGICYLNSENEKDKAITYLEDASQKISEKYNSNSFDESNAPIDALFLLGSAYRVNNQIDKAIEAYNKYKNYLDPKDDYELNVVNQYLKSCELAREMQKNPMPVITANLGRPVNTSAPNFNAVLSGDGKTLFYTSPARQGYDVFLTTFEDTAWATPRNLTSLLGTGKYMKTSDLSYDGKTLILTLDDPMNSDIFISRFVKGRWSKAEPLGKEINSKFNETHASLSTDGNVLYFTSDRKGGQGDLDLYKAEPDGKGLWGKPVNLGPVINTPFNEETPFITEIGDKLFFSSEGHNGIGGYDIYYYDYSNPSQGVVNLGYPINTTDNDLFFVPSGDGHTAYYAFAGDDTYGGRDIYQVVIPPQPEQPEEMTASAGVQTTYETDSLSAVTVAVPETLIPAVQTVSEEPVAETLPAAETVAGTDTTNIPDSQELAISETPAPVEETAPGPEPPETVQNIPDEEPGLNSSLTSETAVVPEVLAGRASASSYRVQIMALRKPVDLTRFSAAGNIMLAVNGDKWYRYIIGKTTSLPDAERLLADLKSKGYRDAFIRPNAINPEYTIQVMAVPGPVVDLGYFSNLPAISVTRGMDTFCRYTTGEYETKEEAVTHLQQIRELGYSTAFVTRLR